MSDVGSRAWRSYQATGETIGLMQTEASELPVDLKKLCKFPFFALFFLLGLMSKDYF